eukprot:6005278-Pyramimonas_sp.AAC.1
MAVRRAQRGRAHGARRRRCIFQKLDSQPPLHGARPRGRRAVPVASQGDAWGRAPAPGACAGERRALPARMGSAEARPARRCPPRRTRPSGRRAARGRTKC